MSAAKRAAPGGRAVRAAAGRALGTGGLALLLVAALAGAAGAPPLAAVRALLAEAFGSPFAWSGTLLYAAPLLFTGLAVAWAFRAGLFNIGAEGQLLWGALAAAWVGSALSLPAPLHLPLALAAGAAAGALWAAPAALLRRPLSLRRQAAVRPDGTPHRGVPEAITTLLLNFAALHLTTWLAAHPLHAPNQPGARTAEILPTARLPLLAPDSALHAGLLLAAGCAALLALLIRRSRLGFQLQAVGRAPAAARTAGLPVDSLLRRALLQSGALAGLAGAVEVLGVHHFFQAGFSPGYGYEGIAVAILGGGTPGGALLAALLLGGLANGAVGMALDLNLSSEVGRSMVAVVQAAVLLVVAARRWPWLGRAEGGRSGRRRGPAE